MGSWLSAPPARHQAPGNRADIARARPRPKQPEKRTPDPVTPFTCDARCRTDLLVRSPSPLAPCNFYIWRRSYRMTWDRLYSSARWRRFTRLYLRMHPTCVRCNREGQTFESTIVHHLEEYRPGDSDLKFWVGPFEAVCKKHHLQIHGWPAMRPYDRTIALDGFPVDEEQHPFWKASRRQEEQERKWQKDSARKKATR